MLLNQIKKTIDRHRLLNRGDRVIVGVSGGADSMVLLHVLHAVRQEFDLSLVVAHVNHGLRPEESEREKELVQKESVRLSLPFEYGQFDVKQYSRIRGLSLQDAGRRIRFYFFKTLVLKYDGQKIALGQHADDQVETVLLRLLRGSGLRGLRGMLPLREGRVIRPLLETWRREIESFAREEGISYLCDSSNLKKDYLRNRIRLGLIPLIEREYQPNFKEVLMRTSAALRDEDDYLERESEEAYQKMVRGEDALSFSFSEFQSLHKAVQRRLVQRILSRIYAGEIATEEEEGPATSNVYEKLSRPHPNLLCELPRGVYLKRQYDLVSFGRKKEEQVSPFEAEIASPGRTFIGEIGKEVIVDEIREGFKWEDLGQSPDIAFLDYQNLQLPLKVRNFRPGDRFQPLGVKGTQKVKEFFIDHKIPGLERRRIPLLISGERVVWIVGYRIDERMKISEKTKVVLRIEVI